MLRASIALFVLPAALAMPGVAQAQAAPEQAPQSEADATAAADARTAQMMANERALVRVASPRAGCPAPVEGLHGTDDSEIVVCARARARDQQVPSSEDEAGDTSRAATQGGTPHVPDSLVSNLPDCSPGHGCKRVGRGHAPIYYIDTTKLPPPPPGSDAEKVANGEMPAP